jgi:hypothetical protein
MPMKLRSGKKIGSNINTQNQPFKLIILQEKLKNPGCRGAIIDFDKSSEEWRKNKIHLGNGMFKYKN